MGKRNIEELFRERFKDFEETPDITVWKSIEASIDKKKRKKRLVPIWWQLGGAAALFALLLYIINPFEGDGLPTNTEVSNTEQQTDTDSDQQFLENEDADQPAVVLDEVQTPEDNTEDNEVPHDGVAVTDASKKEEGGNQNKSRLQSHQNTAVVGNDKSSNTEGSDLKRLEERSTANDGKNPFNLPKEKEEVVVAVDDNSRETPENLLPKDKTPSGFETNGKQEAEVVFNEKANANEKELQKELIKNDLKMQNRIEESEEVVENTKEDEPQEEGKKSIYDEIVEEEEQALADNSKEKWSVGPSVAPVYFNSIGEGSPIHSNFAANSKSGNLNLSYGLTVSYDLGKKLTLRSGVHRVDFGYDTEDIVFSSSISGSTNAEIDNIDYLQTSRNLVVRSKSAVNNQASSPTDGSTDLFGLTPELEGRMVQQLGYIEVPVELNYALVDKKIGINLIGGVSSLFLIDNTVSLESDARITEMGSANNINDLNFSTNFGVGFNYHFTEKIQLNLEPIFKYQLNTFTNTAGNFRPFSIGVYSGVNFRF